MTSPSTIKPKFLSNGDELGVVAVGFSGGQCKPGVDAAPSALIASGLLDQLQEELGYKLFHDGAVHSYSSIIPSPDPDYRNMKQPLAVSAVTRQLSQQVYEHARQGRYVLTLGGDHSIAIGTISGTAKAIRERLGQEMAVIWVDAHADINTPETSGSGNIHGMPVAFLAGLATEKRVDVFGWLQEDQKMSLKKLVYIGLRDVDRGEKKILRDHGIKAFSMHDIDKHGIGRVMEMALGHIGTDTPIHLSFDVDALDPQWAPSTGTPVRGGLTLREGDFIAECVHETGNLIAMDLVEVNPSLEAVGAAETIRAGCSLVRCALAGPNIPFQPLPGSETGIAYKPNDKRNQIEASRMDKLKDLAGKAGGSSGSGQPAGQKDDYLDKGVDAAGKKFGQNIDPSTREKFTDQGREMFEKQTGKDIPDKVSN
ncbi:MAG: hypothetical protein LQ350_001290 [Teloschistes chrysophthalmus]|nr:MAG: hypothetical protein LQ350_001290 [Niorma chrysophthalma]